MATAKSKPQIPAARNSKSQHDRKLKLASKSISISQKTNPVTATARKASPKVPKLEKPVFKGKSICSIGTYKRNGKVVSHDDISKYVQLHGGEYVKEVTDTTTHLICSVGEFERKGSDKNVNLQRALRLAKRRCCIVVYDWFEDCLLGPKGKKRLVPEKQYTLDRVMDRLASNKQLTPEYFVRFEEGSRASNDLVDNKLYHIHFDKDGFEYKVVLSRLPLGGTEQKETWEKYTLYLFESNAIPHVYMVGAKLSRRHRTSSMWREFCHPMTFYDAFNHFQHFFQQKTGVHWNSRLEPLPKTEDLLPPKKIRKVGNTPAAQLAIQPPIIDLKDLRFKYLRPAYGLPVGLLPYDYIKPEDRPDWVPPPCFYNDQYKQKAGSVSGTERETVDDQSGSEISSVANTYDSERDAEHESDSGSDEQSGGSSYGQLSLQSADFSAESSDTMSDASKSRSGSHSGSNVTLKPSPHSQKYVSSFSQCYKDSKFGVGDEDKNNDESLLSNFSHAPKNPTQFNTSGKSNTFPSSCNAFVSVSNPFSSQVRISNSNSLSDFSFTSIDAIEITSISNNDSEDGDNDPQTLEGSLFQIQSVNRSGGGRKVENMDWMVDSDYEDFLQEGSTTKSAIEP